MTADSEYIERVRAYDWDDVTGLWRDIQRCATPGWDAGKALEYLVLKGFELSGATVRWPYTVKFVDEKILEQIDGVIFAAGIAAMIECKDYSDSSSRTKRRIGSAPIALLQAKLTRRPAALIGCLFASGEYTEAAEGRVNFTKPATILCWTGDDIDRCVHRRNFTQTLQRKFRTCIEEGKHLAKCSI